MSPTTPVDPERVAKARERLIGHDDAARLSSILSLLADPTRTRVIYALDLADELCVGDIALALELGEDAVGYALRILRTAGMVTRRKAGRTVYYRLADGFPEPLRMHCLVRLIEISDTPSDDEE
ncbi:winged helix-turn-helix transcriptional regulator [Rhodococcus triatomae]|uniref:DNA-binding transcriptional regulator, ArsR family n=1 Tax=Rhodococcus triatomae TaxID=300028 RepID=A0A1G8QJW7_9NOCA|nr:metalloregulator ArsR/SmtB family transcription factor [Rhodococcus triatomae]QNG20657.1 winged helix-turn-helix transcriptional regulator [Rhodococcus triatomae]QNG23425.1 winged helix-turn-helix transcriptional regulator [Rhodococcus triatomae]SDJ04705.1 DNA-binding transcriptional regulator, ArsR family [Rhodococcus triatomae]